MVYLIHFDRKLHHAAHYLGFVEGGMLQLKKRLKRHRKNRGSKLLKALNLAGIGWDLAFIWPEGDRNFERQLKNRKNSKCLCPMCKGEKPLKINGKNFSK